VTPALGGTGVLVRAATVPGYPDTLPVVVIDAFEVRGRGPAIPTKGRPIADDLASARP
jgi:hypothetical protein